MVRQRIILVLFAVMFSMVRLGVAQDQVSQESASAPREVTYNKDVAPILYSNCVKCHRPDDIAPMSLMTYKETRLWAPAIREAVVQRKMPPWHADPKLGDFLNERRRCQRSASGS